MKNLRRATTDNGILNEGGLQLLFKEKEEKK